MMLPTIIAVENSSSNENCEDHELGRYQIFPTRAKELLIEAAAAILCFAGNGDKGVRLLRAIHFWNTALKEGEWLGEGNCLKTKCLGSASLLFIFVFVQIFSVLFLNTWCFEILYLVSPGRKEIGMFSWQPWPGCQLDLQAEQNSMSQALHWTSWGSCGLDSWSWQTAWQVEDGHQVRHGSKSTSIKGYKRTTFKGSYKTNLP